MKRNFRKYIFYNHQWFLFFIAQYSRIFFSLYQKFPLNRIIHRLFVYSMKNHTFYTFDLLETFQEFFQKIQHKILIKMVKRKNEK